MLEAIGLFIGFVVAMISLNASSQAQHQQNQYNKELVDQQNQYNKEALQEQAALNEEFWKKQNEYNLPINQMKRLADAGINKNLAASYIQGNSTQLSAPTVTPNIAAGKNAFNPQDILGNLMGMFSGAGNRIQQSVNVKVNTENAKIQQEILNLNKRVLQGKADSQEYKLKMEQLSDNFMVQDKDGNYKPAWMLKVEGQSANALSQILLANFIPQEQSMKVGKFMQEKQINRLNIRSLEQMLDYNEKRHPLEVSKLKAELKSLEEQGKLREFENRLNSFFTDSDLQQLVDGKVAAAQLISDKVKTFDELDFNQLNSLADVVTMIIKILRLF